MAAIHGLLNEFVKLDRTYSLNTPSSTERGEKEVLTAINKAVKEAGKPITVSVGKFTFKNIVGANKISGTPKADIALVSYNKNKLENVCFISHKLGTGAKDFQQYSGITPKADGAVPGSISQNSTVKAFLKKIAERHDMVKKLKKRYHSKIKDKELIGKAVFGPLYGSTKFGEDNIHLIGQGRAILKKGGNATYTLTFTSHMVFNPDVKPFMTNDFTAILGARYTDGRNFQINNKNYDDVRILILPIKVIGGNSEEI